jgi:pimeloyl-ACP methyl ester carboxylesterase
MDGEASVLRKAAALLTVGSAMLLVEVAAAQRIPIEEARFLRLGGIDQWITIRGSGRATPILLILHGGPGETQSPLAATYAPLERDFVVVQWDQRGGGKTLARAGTASQDTSLDLLIRDAIELTEYIRTYLNTNNVILIGHSWGSFLGVHIVMRRPELFRAFVGTGQVVSWPGIVDAQLSIYAESRSSGIECGGRE